MTLLKISKLGHPVLRTPAKEVPLEHLADEPVQRLIEDMIETMRDADGVGIAAPQVYQPLRLAVIEVHRNPRYPQAPDVRLTVLVNPRFAYKSEETARGWEGCLSVDGFRGQVPRHRRVIVEAFDREGQPFTIDSDNFLAVVLQHELDHLDGKVYLDRMTDMLTLAHLKEYEEFWLPPGRG